MVVKGGRVFVHRVPAAVKVVAITPTELTVLVGVGSGLENKAIGDAMSVSAHTVKFHLYNVMGKLGVRTRTGVVIKALQLGVISLRELEVA